MKIIEKAFKLLENAKNKDEYLRAVTILKSYGAKKSKDNEGNIIWEVTTPITTNSSIHNEELVWNLKSFQMVLT